MKRREFVKTTGAAVATGLVVAGCGNDVQPAPILAQALVPAGGQLLVALKTTDGRDHYPDLAPVGGAITIPIQAPAGGGGYPDAILLVHLSDTKTDPLRYIAINSACPHAGCPLGFSAKDFLVECPCHGSRFAVSPASTGGCPNIEVNHPPAPSTPTAYAIAIAPDGGSLTIDLQGGASFKFADFPQLANPGGVAVSLCPPIVVVRQDASTVAAYSGVCTHMQCSVNLVGGAVTCPCHGSVFGTDGHPTKGPATQPLKTLTATLKTDGIDVVS